MRTSIVAVTDRRFEKRGIGADAHGFDISIGSLISVFNPGAGIQIKVVGFTVNLWRLPILDNILRIKEVAESNLGEVK